MAYTTIDDPSAYFQTALYTGGNGSNNTPIDVTNSGNSDLQPDWVWIKRRDGAASHGLFDSSRGVNKILNSDSTDAEVTGETEMISYKFEHEGYHYIYFHRPNFASASGITLDPDYMFQGDTITYNGNKYIKIQ